MTSHTGGQTSQKNLKLDLVGRRDGSVFRDARSTLASRGPTYKMMKKKMSDKSKIKRIMKRETRARRRDKKGVGFESEMGGAGWRRRDVNTR